MEILFANLRKMTDIKSQLWNINAEKRADWSGFQNFLVTLQPIMTETLLISGGLLAAGLALLLVKVLTKKDGTFASQHIHDSEAMRERGIHCVLDQDREMRRPNQHAVKENTGK